MKRILLIAAVLAFGFTGMNTCSGQTDLVAFLESKPSPTLLQLKYAIAKGADVNLEVNGTTPLTMAVVKDMNPFIVNELVRSGARVDKMLADGSVSLLALAVINSRNTETIKILLEAGAKPDESATFAAVKGDNLEKLKMLVQYGGQLDWQHNSDRNLLKVAAASCSNPKILAFLVSSGFEIDSTDTRVHCQFT